MNKQCFIRTSDSDTARQLENMGFQKIDEQNGFHVFLNNKTLTFSENENKLKIQYTNMLHV